MNLDKKGAKGSKKKKGIKKKAKKDPNEPPKPLSAYASFFRDTQASIKSRNPDATFGEVSKIVSSMWESLDFLKKKEYKEKADMEKKEYLEALAIYKESKGESDGIGLGPNLVELPEPSNSGPIVETLTVTKPDSPDIDEQEGTKLEHELEVIDLSKTEEDDDDTEVITIEESDSPDKMAQVGDVADAKENEEPEKDDPNIVNGENLIIEEEMPVCIRSGCTNRAIDSPEWDKEYCSSECVIEHCNYVFMAHLAARQRKAKEEVQA